MSEMWMGNRWRRRRYWGWLWCLLGLAAILVAFGVITYFLNTH